MVSVSGANSAMPLVEEYNAISQSIAAAQAAVQAGLAINYMQATAGPNDLQSSVPLSAADSATILNSLITIWTNMQNNLTTEINAIV